MLTGKNPGIANKLLVKDIERVKQHTISSIVFLIFICHLRYDLF